MIEFDRDDAPPVWGVESVAGARTAAYQQLSAVYDEVERQSGMSSLEGVSSSGAHSQAPVLVTQVCWLNRTLRTWASPGIVAQVSSDPAVVSIDVPRRLMPHLGPGGLTAENDDASHGNGHAAVGLQGGQPLPFTGKGVIVAVIDSEVASQHPALVGRVVHRRNDTKEPWGNPGSHGTAVAGVIASNDAIFMAASGQFRGRLRAGFSWPPSKTAGQAW